MLRVGDLKAAYKRVGEDAYAFTNDFVVPSLMGKKDPNTGQIIKLKPQDFNFRALWEAMVGDPHDTINRNLVATSGNLVQRQMAVDATGFPVVVGSLLGQSVIEGYDSVPAVGENLVENMPSTRRNETIPGFTAAQGIKEVHEGDDYEAASFGEKYVTSAAMKKGRIISITEELVMEDQTNQVLARAREIGESARRDKEKTIMTGIIDLNSNVYRPSGVAEALWEEGAGKNNAIATTALTDWSSIDAVWQHHAANISLDPENESGDPLLWNPMTILVPNALRTDAMRIVQATQIREVTDSATTETISSNPASGMTVFSSPYLDRLDATNGTTAWYMGEFPKQFGWQEIWPLQTFQQNASSDAAYKRDIIASFKVRYYGGIFAKDYRWVLRAKA